MTLPIQSIHPALSQNTQTSSVDNLVEWVVSQDKTAEVAGSNLVSAKNSRTSFLPARLTVKFQHPASHPPCPIHNHPINQTQTQTPNNHQPTPTKPSASSTANSQISPLSHSHINTQAHIKFLKVMQPQNTQPPAIHTHTHTHTQTPTHPVKRPAQ